MKPANAHRFPPRYLFIQVLADLAEELRKPNIPACDDVADARLFAASADGEQYAYIIDTHTGSMFHLQDQGTPHVASLYIGSPSDYMDLSVDEAYTLRDFQLGLTRTAIERHNDAKLIAVTSAPNEA